jgi:hypothetical protein
MSKKENSDQRAPVPENPVSGFQMTVCILARQLGIDKISEVFHYVEILSDACDRYIFEDAHKVSPKKKTDTERKRFIAVFKSRYLQFTDYEYDRAITGVDSRMVDQTIKGLEKDGFTLDEYLRWAFDDFYVENPKFCPPTIKQVCSSFVIERFRFLNRDKMKQKYRDELNRKEGMSLIGRGRVLLRAAKQAGMEEKREQVKKTLSEYGARSIILGEFRRRIELFEAEAVGWALNKET